MTNKFHDPKVDTETLLIHAQRLAPMTDSERQQYLNDFCGRRTPPPANGYKPEDRGASIADLIGPEGVLTLLASAAIHQQLANKA